ncbi:hypothetical protein TSUD_215160 [Trifolium subterraneum]|uniref:Uncharacterized protein n=1 Tax=Trifolium subterraneum TaxID=3900 RepID=A0A2Z6N767_TRISU|nr:hypothetical protein TSUD_215160 [Trifolium subterraneum]
MKKLILQDVGAMGMILIEKENIDVPFTEVGNLEGYQILKHIKSTKCFYFVSEGPFLIRTEFWSCCALLTCRVRVHRLYPRCIFLLLVALARGPRASTLKCSLAAEAAVLLHW